VRAAVAGLALRLAGLENVMVYDGSMHEWSRYPHLELVRGLGLDLDLDDVVLEAAAVKGDCD